MKPGYADAARAFRWERFLDALGWMPDGDVNLGHTLVDRHRASGRMALRWFGKTGETRAWTFAELSDASGRVANLLSALGLRKGDRVAGFMPRVPETIAILLGAWKAGAIYVPIFTGFGPDAVRFRLEHSGARILCTHRDHRSQVPAVDGVACLDVSSPDIIDAVAKQSTAFDPVPTRRDDPAVLLYTSGSTGPPKGVKIATNFPLAILPYIHYGVDLLDDDVFWPTGDPGWGYGLVGYMVALAIGATVICHEAPPSPEFALERLRDLGVTNLATTPTVLRGIMALGEARIRRDPVRLRCLSTCGEPLNDEVVTFFRRVWGVTVMDQYGSSEFGLPIGNFNALAMDVKAGSMGLPLPGCRMAIVDDDGREVGPDIVGHIGMWPSDVGYYSLGYWNDGDRTREVDQARGADAPLGLPRQARGADAPLGLPRRGGWMTIGDLARRDRDGYFWFEGRADDVIKSAGYRIGPFEVESAILHHPDVAEAAIVGKPDAMRGQIVKAFVVLKVDRPPRPGLAEEIVDVVRARVGRHQYPREVEFVEQLPKTESGKIQRFRLRAT